MSDRTAGACKAAARCVAGAWLLLSVAAGAQTPNTVSDRGSPLVRELERRYAQAMQSARSGDVEGYWRYRTAAARKRPPELDAPRLRLLAQLLPPLESLQFVRLDATGKMARTLYRWRKTEVAQYTAIIYRLEKGEWKIDDVSIKRGASGSETSTASTTGAPTTRASPAAQQLRALPTVPQAQSRPPVTAAPQSAGAQEQLRAWEGSVDPNRSLSPPRL
jgi:hypothetical protein